MRNLHGALLRRAPASPWSARVAALTHSWPEIGHTRSSFESDLVTATPAQARRHSGQPPRDDGSDRDSGHAAGRPAAAWEVSHQRVSMNVLLESLAAGGTVALMARSGHSADAGEAPASSWLPYRALTSVCRLSPSANCWNDGPRSWIDLKIMPVSGPPYCSRIVKRVALPSLWSV